MLPGSGLDGALAHSDVDRHGVRGRSRLGINGVPCFIVNRKYAVSGAQPPPAFIEVFNLAEREGITEHTGMNRAQLIVGIVRRADLLADLRRLDAGR